MRQQVRAGLSQDLHFLPEQARDVADQTPLLVQASFPVEFAQEVVHGDPVLSREICVPAGTLYHIQNVENVRLVLQVRTIFQLLNQLLTVHVATVISGKLEVILRSLF